MKLQEIRNGRNTLPLLLLTCKRREFDDFLGFFAGSENPSVRVAHFAFEITLSGAITLTLLLVCAFSPKVQKYLLGSPFLMSFRVLPKKQNIAVFIESKTMLDAV